MSARIRLRTVRLNAAPTVGHEAIRRMAVAALKANDTGKIIIAGEGLYPHRWGWDSAINAIGLARFDPKRAVAEISAQMEAQWKNGKVPHIQFNPAAPAEAYFPGPARWEVHQVARVKGPRQGIETSALVQPPFQAIAALEVLKADPRLAGQLKELYPKFVKWHAYLHDQRVGGSGLVDIVHPWESGTDNSPRWDAPLRQVKVDKSRMEPFVRRDLKPDGSNKHERPSNDEYDRYIWLVEQYKRAGYNDGRYLPNAEFRVGDVLFTAVLARADEALLELAQKIGVPADPSLKRWATQSRRAILKQWDPSLGGTFDFDQKRREPLRTLTLANFAPLVAGRLDSAQLKAQLDLLESPKFLGNPSLKRRLPPSTSPEDPAFDPARYWRGPNWAVSTWILWRALNAASKEAKMPALAARANALASALRSESLAQASRNGAAEYAHAVTDAPLGSKRQSWTAATLLDML